MTSFCHKKLILYGRFCVVNKNCSVFFHGAEKIPESRAKQNAFLFALFRPKTMLTKLHPWGCDSQALFWGLVYDLGKGICLSKSVFLHIVTTFPALISARSHQDFANFSCSSRTSFASGICIENCRFPRSPRPFFKPIATRIMHIALRSADA